MSTTLSHEFTTMCGLLFQVFSSVITFFNCFLQFISTFQSSLFLCLLSTTFILFFDSSKNGRHCLCLFSVFCIDFIVFQAIFNFEGNLTCDYFFASSASLFLDILLLCVYEGKHLFLQRSFPILLFLFFFFRYKIHSTPNSQFKINCHPVV